MNVRKCDGGMWLSREAWRLLANQMIWAKYTTDGGGIKIPPSEEQIALLKVMEMAKADGLEFEELT